MVADRLTENSSEEDDPHHPNSYQRYLKYFRHMTTGHMIMMILPDGVRTISGTGDGDKQLFFLSVSLSCFGCWGEEGSEDVR